MDTLLTNWHVLPAGLGVTLSVAAIAILIGTPVGFLIGIINQYGPLYAQLVFKAYVSVLRGLPVLVTIFIIFYGPTAVGLDMPRLMSVAVALGVFMSAHMAEITRGAISAIPPEQTEAAKSIGLRFWQRLFSVILPQAMRRAAPPWTNLCVEIVKGTSLVSLVGVADLMLSARHVIERTGEPLVFYGVLAVLYFAINFSISTAAKALERKYSYAN